MLQSFVLLDRPAIEARPGLLRQDIPMVEAEVLVDTDVVFLEAIDDGRLDRLVDRFTTVAGSNIPPAHPRTKIIGTEPRHELALVWRRQIPDGISDEENDRLKREQVAHIIAEVWPNTPQPALRRRTPLQAGQAGDSETFLRGVNPCNGVDVRATRQTARLERSAVKASLESRAANRP